MVFFGQTILNSGPDTIHALREKLVWHIIKEGIFILIAALIFAMTVFFIRDHISGSYLLFFALAIFICVQYFRVVINEQKVFWIRPFIIKVLFGLGNIVLFLYMMDSFFILVGQFEDYSYTGVGVVTPDIYPGLSAAGYDWLRSSTFFAGMAVLFMIILFELRLVYSIFKYRDVPGILK
jgi:hypothetical protein